MTVRAQARHYTRHWNFAAPGKPRLADNAPAELRTFIAAAGYDTNLIFDALVSLSTSAKPFVPPADEILKWFAAHPLATRYCDEILAGKRPAKTFGELLERAYRTELQAVLDATRKFLNEQLTAFAEQ